MSRRRYSVAFMGVLIFLTLSVHFVHCQKNERPANLEEVDPSFWEGYARKRLQKTFNLLGSPTKPAKNVILFLGDGMGIPTVSASRFYKTEVKKSLGSVTPELEFEDWPFHTLVRTYDLNTVVTDSASSATAYLGGTKTITGLIGLTGAVKPKECRVYKEEEKVESILKAAAKAGKATGIVTTSRITHASPAGAFGHTASRHWESDTLMKDDCASETNLPKDLARQLIEDNPDINVMLGGGYHNFNPIKANGSRSDGRYLLEEWLETMVGLGRNARLIKDSQEFLKSDFSKVDYLLGILTSSHMPYEADRPEDVASLSDMTNVAIKILSRQSNGFFLFVEGARIDHAHHANLGKKALIDTLAFEKAIREAKKLVDLEETLLIVTADHSHSFHLVGEPSRLKSLFDLDKKYDKYIKDDKGMTPILYSSGPSAAIHSSRKDLHSLNATTHSKNFLVPSLVPMERSTHGGDDVGVYATGVFSHLFHSTVDNTFIAQAMKFAMCVPPFELESHCSSSSTSFGISALSIIDILPVIRRYFC